MKRIILTLIAGSFAFLATSTASADGFWFATTPPNNNTGGTDLPGNEADCTKDGLDIISDGGNPWTAGDCETLDYTSDGGVDISAWGGTGVSATSGVSTVMFVDSFNPIIQDLDPEMGGLGTLSGLTGDTDNVDGAADEWIAIQFNNGPETVNTIYFTDHDAPDSPLTAGADVALWYYMGGIWYLYGETFELYGTYNVWNVWFTADLFVLHAIGDPFYLAGFEIPEPATIALFGLGLLGMGAARRRRVK